MRSFTPRAVIGAVACVGAVALSACANADPTAVGAPGADADRPAAMAPGTPDASESETTSAAVPEAPTTSAAVPKSGPSGAKGGAKTPVSDLSQLRQLGIDLDKGVLIDVADDGEDRYLQISANGVDFTGTTKTDSTMMALKAAPVRERNRVLIKPPFWNEEVGAGYCVADTAGAPLKLEVCEDGRAAQVWTIVPAGDSGQFELHGIYGVVRVADGKITTGETGRIGLQTIPFAS